MFVAIFFTGFAAIFMARLIRCLSVVVVVPCDCLFLFVTYVIYCFSFLNYYLCLLNTILLLYKYRGRVDDLSFFVIQVHFFLLIELHVTFSISYKILTNYVYYYFI